MNQWLVYIIGGLWALGSVSLIGWAAYEVVRLLGRIVEKWEEKH
ncbi:hypothetical protein ACFV1L_10440 [Kitasatospora sp. NPDC059646]